MPAKHDLAPSAGPPPRDVVAAIRGVSKVYSLGGHQVKALDNVRDHIRTTIAEANLGRELSESSLDSRLEALRNQAGDVQARQQLADMKAKRAAQQAAQGQKTL